MQSLNVHSFDLVSVGEAEAMPTAKTWRTIQNTMFNIQNNERH